MKIKAMILPVILALAVGCYTSITYAQIKTITETVTYNMGEAENFTEATQHAIEYARRRASERIYVYVESYSKSHKSTIEEDTIKVASALIMKDRTEPIIKKQLNDKGGVDIIVTVTVDFDTDQIKNAIDKIRSNVGYKNKYHNTSNDYQKLQDEKIKFNDKYKFVPDSFLKEQTVFQTQNKEKLYAASECMKKGLIAQNKNDSEGAIKYYTEAIKLNHYLAGAYNNRGIAYQVLGRYQMAINDFAIAIARNPHEMGKYYYNLGNAYLDARECYQAVTKFTKAIELMPDNVMIYNNRGVAYSFMGKYQEAISDFSRAIMHDDKNAYTYVNRGIAYEKQGSYKEASRDYDKALNLGSKESVDIEIKSKRLNIYGAVLSQD